jgi:hypothetical protein
MVPASRSDSTSRTHRSRTAAAWSRPCPTSSPYCSVAQAATSRVPRDPPSPRLDSLCYVSCPYINAPHLHASTHDSSAAPLQRSHFTASSSRICIAPKGHASTHSKQHSKQPVQRSSLIVTTPSSFFVIALASQTSIHFGRLQ